MKRILTSLALILTTATASLYAQQQMASSSLGGFPPISGEGSVTSSRSLSEVTRNASPAPFSRVAIGGGVSSMGVNMQVAVIANRYMNLRGTGNFFNYSLSNVNVNGFNASGKLNFATAGASVDFYPFPNHGLRISPGAMFYNQNQLGATVVAPGGTSFTLDGYTYYSSQSNPVTGAGNVFLNKQSPAFTITTGWGNMISRRGSHFSVPFEIGAAFIGAPSVNMALTSGQVCADPAGTIACQNVVGNAQINANLQAQVAKYQNDVNPFKIYPIVSTGVAFSFGKSVNRAK